MVLISHVNVSNSANSSEYANLTGFTFDGTPPNITLNLPVDTANLSSTDVTFNFTANDGVSIPVAYELTIDGIVNKTGPTNGTLPTGVTVAGFSEGSHTWNVTVTDDAGNSVTSATWTFTVTLHHQP